MPGMDGFISFNGTLNGSIEGGSGGDVADVKVRHSQSTEYVSVVDSEKIALIDLISYVRRNELAQDLMVLEDNFDLKLDLKQNNLIAGENITIENNIISAASGSSTINYSTDEQDTGILWTDGRHIFQKTFIWESNQTLNTAMNSTPFNVASLNIDSIVDVKISCVAPQTTSPLFVQPTLARIYNNLLQIQNPISSVVGAGSKLTVKYIKTEV